MVEAVRPRVLLMAGTSAEEGWRGCFAHPALAEWSMVPADTLERGRLQMQAQPCEVAVLDGELLNGGGPDWLAWLMEQTGTPALVACPPVPALLAGLFASGASAWLPRDLALGHPEVLAGALRPLAVMGELHRRVEATGNERDACQRRVDRLVGMLWQTTPAQGPGRWFSQRHLMERLDEEVARARRHGGPLAVVLGEVGPGGDAVLDTHELADWAAVRIGQSKRRCDVAGQYGLRGFMLLLPRTAQHEAEGACRRLAGALEQPGQAPFPPLRARFGIASLGPEANTVQALLRQAEEHLDAARDAGP